MDGGKKVRIRIISQGWFLSFNFFSDIYIYIYKEIELTDESPKFIPTLMDQLK